MPRGFFIGGVGYWQQQRTQKSNQPTRIEVRSLQILPPTPSDIARGFDTRVKLSLGYSGAKPRGWGVKDSQEFSLTLISDLTVSSAKTSPLMQVKAWDVENRYDDKSDAYIGTYLMKLREVSSDTAIKIEGALQSQAPYQIALGMSTIVKVENDLQWDAVVRRKGAKTSAPPRVSRFTGLKVKKIGMLDMRTQLGRTGAHIFVTVEIAPGLVDERPLWKRLNQVRGDGYLSDIKGRKYSCYNHSPVFKHWRKSDDAPESTSEVKILFQAWQNLPTNLNAAIFHAQISVDDLWPLEIEIPVKDIAREP